MILRYWFEHGGGCLWSADEETKERFGYKVDYKILPISEQTKERLQNLEERYLTYLNWNNPSVSSQWNEQEKENFLTEAEDIYCSLCEELGETVAIINELHWQGHAY